MIIARSLIIYILNIAYEEEGFSKKTHAISTPPTPPPPPPSQEAQAPPPPSHEAQASTSQEARPPSPVAAKKRKTRGITLMLQLMKEKLDLSKEEHLVFDSVGIPHGEY